MKKFFQSKTNKKGGNGLERSISSNSMDSSYGTIKEKDLPRLHKAVWTRDMEKVKEFIKDVNVKDKENRTALHLACARGFIEIITLLLEERAKINVADNKGCSPLIRAVHVGAEDCIQLLLEHEADVNAQDVEGNAALHFAAVSGADNIVALLLAMPATNVNILNKNSITPLFIAASSGFINTCSQLLEHGANVDLPDAQGYTPLMAATLQNWKDTVTLLLEHNADFRLKDVRGWTAEDIAMQQRHEDIQVMLADFAAKTGRTTPRGSVKNATWHNNGAGRGDNGGGTGSRSTPRERPDGGSGRNTPRDPPGPGRTTPRDGKEIAGGNRSGKSTPREGTPTGGDSTPRTLADLVGSQRSGGRLTPREGDRLTPRGEGAKSPINSNPVTPRGSKASIEKIQKENKKKEEKNNKKSKKSDNKKQSIPTSGGSVLRYPRAPTSPSQDATGEDEDDTFKVKGNMFGADSSSDSDSSEEISATKPSNKQKVVLMEPANANAGKNIQATTAAATNAPTLTTTSAQSVKSVTVPAPTVGGNLSKALKRHSSDSSSDDYDADNLLSPRQTQLVKSEVTAERNSYSPSFAMSGLPKYNFSDDNAGQLTSSLSIIQDQPIANTSQATPSVTFSRVTSPPPPAPPLTTGTGKSSMASIIRSYSSDSFSDGDNEHTSTFAIQNNQFQPPASTAAAAVPKAPSPSNVYDTAAANKPRPPTPQQIVNHSEAVVSINLPNSSQTHTQPPVPAASKSSPSTVEPLFSVALETAPSVSNATAPSPAQVRASPVPTAKESSSMPRSPALEPWTVEIPKLDLSSVTTASPTVTNSTSHVNAPINVPVTSTSVSFPKPTYSGDVEPAVHQARGRGMPASTSDYSADYNSQSSNSRQASVIDLLPTPRQFTPRSANRLISLEESTSWQEFLKETGGQGHGELLPRTDASVLNATGQSASSNQYPGQSTSSYQYPLNESTNSGRPQSRSGVAMATRISAATLDSEGDGEMILQLKQDNADLRRRLEESLKRRHVLECAQIDHDTTVSRLQFDLSVEAERANTAESRLQSLQDERDAKDKKYTSEMQARSEAEMKLRQLKYELMSANTQLEQLKADQEVLEERLRNSGHDARSAKSTGANHDVVDGNYDDSEKNQLRATVLALQKELARVQVQCEHEASKVSRLTEEAKNKEQALTKDIQLHKDAMTRLSVTLNKVMGEKEAAERSLGEERVRRSRVDADMERRFEERLAQEMAKLRLGQSQSQDRKQYSEEDVANMQRLLAHYKSEADSKENSQRELYEQVTSLKRTVAKLEGEVRVNVHAASDKAKQLSQTQQLLDDARSQASSLRQCLQDTIEEKIRLETKMEALTEKVAALQVTNQKSERLLLAEKQRPRDQDGSHSAANDQLRGVIMALQAELDHEKEAQRAHKLAEGSAVSRLGHELDEERQRADRLARQLADVSLSVKQKEAELVATHQQLMDTRSKLEVMNTMKDQTIGNLGDLRTQNAVLVTECERQKSTIAALYTSLAKANEEKLKLQSEMETLKSENFMLTDRSSKASLGEHAAMRSLEETQKLWQHQVHMHSKLGLKLIKVEQEKKAMESLLGEEKLNGVAKETQGKMMEERLSVLQKQLRQLEKTRRQHARAAEMDNGELVVAHREHQLHTEMVAYNQLEAAKSHLRLQAQMALNERLAAMNAYFEEQQVTREQAEKKRRHRDDLLRADYEATIEELKGDNNQLRSKISELTLAKAKYEEESARYRALYEHEYKVRDNIVSQLNSDHYYVVPALANKSTAAQDTSPTPANTEKRQQDASLMDSLRYQLDKSFAQHLANGADLSPPVTRQRPLSVH